MTVKETMEFIKRKYDTKINNDTKDINKEIYNNQNELKKLENTFKSEMKKMIFDKANENGIILQGIDNISMYLGSTTTEKICNLVKQKNDIISSLEKEKEHLLDEIMILGVKDESIKEKLKKLLEI